MNELERLQKLMIAFRDERDWAQYHNLKDLAVALSLEAAEVLELFLWKQGDGVATVAQEKRQELQDELADTMAVLLLMAHEAGINLSEAFEAKLEKTKAKYPVEKAKGKSTKYTDLV